MERQWNTGSQNYKNEKSAAEFCHSGLLSDYKCNFAQTPMSKTKFFKTTSNNFSKITGPIVLKFHMEHDKIGSGRKSKMATNTKNCLTVHFFYFHLSPFALTYQTIPNVLYGGEDLMAERKKIP